MGWLRDLMNSADPPLKSFDSLARAVLSHSAWADESKPQPRSLSALLGKLDRGRELDWLLDRPWVQGALAETLGRPVADIRLAIDLPPAQPESQRYLVLEDLPFARALDLTREPLCPGIPESVMDPSDWKDPRRGGLWWHAPNGAGRSLVGRWLEARGLARFVRADSWQALSEAVARHPSVYVEFRTPPKQIEPVLAPLGRVCVAAPFPPPSAVIQPSVYNGAGFEFSIEPPLHPSQYLRALLAWVSERLPQDGHFDADFAERWFREAVLPAGYVSTLGDVLGLCGLLDQLSIKRLKGVRPDALIEQFYELRLAESQDEQARTSSFLRESGLRTLLGIFQQTLTDSNEPWDTPRHFEDWLTLVPVEHQRGVDFEWMQLSLSQTSNLIRPKDVAEAAKRMPPGAYRTLRALQNARLLRPSSDESDKSDKQRLRLGPRWFGAALCARAFKSLSLASPFEWGEVLLNPVHAPAMRAEIWRRIQAGDTTPIDRVLEADAADNPAYVAALELSFRAAGLALLAGVELSQEQVEELWEAQLRVMLDFAGPRLPRPRLSLSGQLPALATADLRALDTPGCWYLAAFAISELLPARGRTHAKLRPWLSKDAPALTPMLDEILQTIKLASTSAWALAAFALMDRLRIQFGTLCQPAHPLELPGLLLDEVTHDVLSFETAERVFDADFGVGAAESLARSRNLPLARIAAAVWAAWSDAGKPAARFLDPSSPAGTRLWRHVPGDILLEMLPNLPQTAYPLLADADWTRIAEHYEKQGTLPPSEALRNMPKASLGRLLANPKLQFTNESGMAEAWERMPEECLQRVVRGFENADYSECILLLMAAPAEALEPLLGIVTPYCKALSLPQEILDAVRNWLIRLVDQRCPAWLRAYATLSELENALEPLRLAQNHPI